MKKMNVNVIAAWILGLILAQALFSVAQYYSYITPPSDLRISPNTCFSKRTKAEVSGIVNNNISNALYNGLNSHDQAQTSVNDIQRWLTTTISDRMVQSVNHGTGNVTCNAKFHTVLKAPDEKHSLKASVSGSYSINGTKTGTLYEVSGSVLSALNNQLNND